MSDEEACSICGDIEVTFFEDDDTGSLVCFKCVLKRIDGEENNGTRQ